MPEVMMSELDMFQLSSHILTATATVEEVVIEALTHANPEVQSFIVDIISTNIPNTIMVDDELREIWNTARNRKQDIVDWLMATYRLVSLTAGKEQVLNHVRESYANSIFIGDVIELYNDEDLGSRMAKSAKDVKETLQKHKWALIIIALFSIDLSEFTNEERAAKVID